MVTKSKLFLVSSSQTYWNACTGFRRLVVRRVHNYYAIVISALLPLTLCLAASIHLPGDGLTNIGPKQTVHKSASSQQRDKDVRTLEPGKPIARELAGGQVHSYQIMLTAGQYVQVVVNQRGIDVVVTLFGPSRQKIVEVDYPNSTEGPEAVFFVADTTGSHRLEVRSLQSDAPRARYEVKLEELRLASEQDRTRVAAERAFMEAEVLRARGTAESLRQAVKSYEMALGLMRSVGDRNRQAATLHKLGEAYYDLGQNQKALDFLNEALPLRRSVGDRLGEADTLYWLGFAYQKTGPQQKSIDINNQALTLFRSLGNRFKEAQTLNNIGMAYFELAEGEKALEFLTLALTINRRDPDSHGQAITLFNLGVISHRLERKQKAFEYFSEALPLLRSLGNDALEISTLWWMGAIKSSSGDVQEAFEFYNESLSVSRRVGEKSSEAESLNLLGRLSSDIGEYQQALNSFNDALSISRVARDSSREAISLSNLGSVYFALGEYQRTLGFYNRALVIFRQLNDRRKEQVTLDRIAEVYTHSGDQHKALDVLSQSLTLSRSNNDRRSEAAALNNLSTAYNRPGTFDRALELCNHALQIVREIGDRFAEARVLHNIARTYHEAGDAQRSLAFYEQALLLARSLNDRQMQATTLFNIGVVEANHGNLLNAHKNIDAALRIIESVRTKVSRQDLRISYLAAKHKDYEADIEILMRMHEQQPKGGFNVDALQVSERARARGLLESLSEAHTEIRQGIDPRLLERERLLQKLLNEKTESRMYLLSRPYTAEQATTSAKEIESLIAEYQELEGEIRQMSPRYAALTQPSPLDLKTIKSQLDNDTLLLEYSLGDENSYLWLVSSTDIQSFKLPGRKKIESAASKFIEGLKTDNRIYSGGQTEGVVTRGAEIHRQEIASAALRLSEMLLGPAASQLGQKRLVIVGDGILLKLPFAALPDLASRKQNPAYMQPLILQHELVSLPSISVLATLRNEITGRNFPPKDIVALADPVFYPDDSRVKRPSKEYKNAPQRATLVDTTNVIEKVERLALETGARRDGERLERLKFTKEEADGIVRLVSTNKAKKALDFAANREFVNSGELSQYRYVHFATHGLLDNTHPELTAIVLSLVDENGNPKDGFLRAHEIYNLNLPADVVVLSACETGLGKEVKGEGLIGLTRSFMYAGAARVVVSLWSVRDESTAQLMVSFYRGMIKEGKRPAEALRAAQIEMLKSDRWSAPHFWAAFVLQGEWR
jgi:CHAT domain-containing protein/Tfp pilus assembly protein PilF